MSVTMSEKSSWTGPCFAPRSYFHPGVENLFPGQSLKLTIWTSFLGSEWLISCAFLNDAINLTQSLSSSNIWIIFFLSGLFLISHSLYA